MKDAIAEYNEAMMALNYDYLFKIVVIGDSGIGKSSLLIRYADDGFSELFISTKGVDFKVKTVTSQSKSIKLQIWDTAGQERFRTITTSYYRGAQGVVLCYDITDRASFVRLETWLGEIKKYASSNSPVLLCGLKSDLEPHREVPTTEAADFAKKYGMKFLETSAKKNVGVEAAFQELTDEILIETRKRTPTNDDKPKISPTQNSAASTSWCAC
eukprot:Phypoly_transcript_15390.p1 GENE.Phypoly_transcript_15390~~Phypoly_transcript_15390.p1  ORF type:complete len:214 (+),score=24.21 Phypoly_transcript_15390:236-877(+)